MIDQLAPDPFAPDPWRVKWEEFLRRAVAMQSALLEGACQAADLTGTCGVLVDGNTIRITEDVPFGEIHYASVDLRSIQLDL